MSIRDSADRAAHLVGMTEAYLDVMRELEQLSRRIVTDDAHAAIADLAERILQKSRQASAECVALAAVEKAGMK